MNISLVSKHYVNVGTYYDIRKPTLKVLQCSYLRKHQMVLNQDFQMSYYASLELKELQNYGGPMSYYASLELKELQNCGGKNRICYPQSTH